MTRRCGSRPSLRRRLLAGSIAFLLAAALFPPAGAATASKKFLLEKNKPVSLDLSSGQVRVEQAVFEFPSSVMRLETANKVRITVVNGSQAKVRVGLAVALFDEAGNLVGAGVGGNKGGQVAPGEKTEFSVFFYYVTEQLSSASAFQITLETR